MTIFTVANTKGGVGKTTTAIHLATMLASRGKTLLIDGDTQESSASWAAWRRDADRPVSPTTICLTGQAIFREGKVLDNDFDYTVVDAGGRDSAGLRASLLLADVAIVPVGASNFDAAAMTDLLEIVEMARDFNPKLDVRVLLNRVDPRTNDAADMLVFLGEHNLKVMDVQVCERVAYRRATGTGLTVHEVGGDIKAIQEMEKLLAEVLK